MAYPGYTFAATGGVPPLSWSESGPLPPGLTLSTFGLLSGTPTSPGTYSVSVAVRDSSMPPLTTSVPVSLKIIAAPNTFTLLESHLAVPRSGHTATLLVSGKVLITGGGNGLADSSAEVYDPTGSTFTATIGQMTEARINHTATLLSDSSLPNYGKVLIVGPSDQTAELYDPMTDTFKATGSMNHPRSSPTATLLATSGPNAGKVLIVGGNTTAGDLVAELYDPAKGTFTDTGSTTVLRSGHTATLLTDGRVLVTGGGGIIGVGTVTAELYDPAAGTFTATAGDMTEARTGHTAILLGAADGAENDYVLILGPDVSAELYDPGTQMFASVGSSLSSGTLNTMSLRDDGTVLAAGGLSGIVRCYGYRRVSIAGASLFAPQSNGFTATGSLHTPRDTHTATVLKDGTVLLVGGARHDVSYPLCLRPPTTQVLSSAELFN